jgi:hypothetical protein
MQYLTLSGEELWLKEQFTEEMQKRFTVSNFIIALPQDVAMNCMRGTC